MFFLLLLLLLQLLLFVVAAATTVVVIILCKPPFVLPTVLPPQGLNVNLAACLSDLDLLSEKDAPSSQKSVVKVGVLLN